MAVAEQKGDTDVVAVMGEARYGCSVVSIGMGPAGRGKTAHFPSWTEYA
ncbi:MAG: hypothetical protein ABR863_02660 [Roseiarcus sp.]|jgi:hypothetical protein